MTMNNSALLPCQLCPGKTVHFTSLEKLNTHILVAHPQTVVTPEPAKDPLKLYVAGPMTGFPDYNYPLFHAAADLLRKAGYEVFNPAEIDDMANSPQLWHEYMRLGLAKMLLCQGIAFLDGWENSKGAVIEVNLAYALGMEINHIDAWLIA